jgi:hypothetical protein
MNTIAISRIESRRCDRLSRKLLRKEETSLGGDIAMTTLTILSLLSFLFLVGVTLLFETVFYTEEQEFFRD